MKNVILFKFVNGVNDNFKGCFGLLLINT